MSLEIKNLSLKYAGAKNANDYVLKDLNLEINDGEFTCLLGPSGCGKSSLLGLIAGFVKPSKGELLINGKKITRPDINRTLVFQEYALFPWLNVIENIAFGLKYTISDKEERYMVASRYLKMVGLIEHSKDRIGELSGGMKQRVAIARALAVRPDLLLMDEPFGALDDKTRTEMQQQLIGIWQDLKPSVVFVTHSVDEALILADRILVMNKAKNSDEDSHLGEIKADIRIDAERPRTLNTLNIYRNQVIEALYGSKEDHKIESFDAMI